MIESVINMKKRFKKKSELESFLIAQYGFDDLHAEPLIEASWSTNPKKLTLYYAQGAHIATWSITDKNGWIF